MAKGGGKQVTAGSLVLELNGDAAGLSVAVDEATKKLDAAEKSYKDVKEAETAQKASTASVADSFRNTAVSLAAFQVAMSSMVVEPLKSAITGFSQTGFALDNLARKTKLSVESLGALGYAAEQSGASTEDVGAAFEALGDKMDRARRGDVTAVTDIYKATRLSYMELSKLSPEEQFFKVVDCIKSIGSEADKAEITKRMFGSDALYTMIDQGRDGIQKLMQEGKDLGGPWSEENIAKSKQLAQSIGKITTMLVGMRDSFLSDMADTIVDCLAKGQKLIQWVRDFSASHPALIKTVVVGVAAFGAFMVAVGLAGTALSAIGTVLAVVGGVLAAFLSPWVLIPAAIGGAIAYIVKFTDAGKDMLASTRDVLRVLMESVSSFFGDAWKQIKAGDFSGAFFLMWLKIHRYFADSVAILQEYMSGLAVNLIQQVGKIFGVTTATWGEMADEIGADTSSLGDMVLVGWYAIQNGMLKVWYGLKSAWAVVCGGLRNTWTDYNTWWEKTSNRMLAKVYDISDAQVAEMNRAADRANAKKKQENNAEMAAAIAANDAEGALASEGLKSNMAARVSAGQAERAKRRSEADKRRAELDAVIATYKANIDFDEDKSSRETAVDALPGSDGTGGVKGEADFLKDYRQGQSMITRNSFQAMFGGGDTTDKKALEISEQMLDIVRRIGVEVAGGKG